MQISVCSSSSGDCGNSKLFRRVFFLDIDIGFPTLGVDDPLRWTEQIISHGLTIMSRNGVGMQHGTRYSGFLAVVFFLVGGLASSANAEECECDCPDGEAPTKATATLSYRSENFVGNGD